MPSTYSTRLRLELQATGENRSTWGTKANNTLNMIEAAISGYVTVAMGDANTTLTTANGSTDQARNMIVEVTGTHTAVRNIIVPSVSKVYLIKNSTTGGFAVGVKTAAGTAATVPAGATRVVYCDSLDCYLAQSTLTVAEGGTGAPDAATARTNLGLAIGTNVQAYDADLSAIAALTPADGDFIVGNGTTWVAENGSTARASLGLTIGTNVQAYSASLASLAGLTTSADKVAYTTAENTWAVTTLTAFGRTLIDDADAATARTTLGLGNVNNTSDADKPVSTATNAALNGKFDKTGGTITGSTVINNNLEIGGPANYRLWFHVHGVKKAGFALGNDGALYYSDHAGQNHFTIGPAGSIWTQQLGDLNARIEDRASAWGANHAKQWGNVANALANMTAGGVGSLAFGKHDATPINFGELYAGASIATGNGGSSPGPRLSGTWRCLGQVSSGASNADRSTLFVRVA